MEINPVIYDNFSFLLYIFPSLRKNFSFSYRIFFVTNFVTLVTNLLTHVTKFVIHVTKFVTKNFKEKMKFLI